MTNQERDFRETLLRFYETADKFSLLMNEIADHSIKQSKRIDDLTFQIHYLSKQMDDLQSMQDKVTH